jgi:hypothetical protein
VLDRRRERLDLIAMLSDLAQEALVVVTDGVGVVPVVVGQQMGGLMDPAVGSADLRPEGSRLGKASDQQLIQASKL